MIPKQHRMRKRRAFLYAARKGSRFVRPSFVAQIANQIAEQPEACLCVGFTASRKVGGSVVRNRAKRRLRAAARKILLVDSPASPVSPASRCDIVLIARRDGTLSCSYAQLLGDLSSVVAQWQIGKAARG